MKSTKVHTRYYADVDGKKKRVPGVTTILGVLAKPALIHWAWQMGIDGEDYRKVRDSAASIGTLAHYMIECELKGEEKDLSTYSPEEIDGAENALIKWWQWWENNTLDVDMVEVPLVSNANRFGGTIDCVGWLNNRYELIDIKTSKGIYDEMLYQLGAYCLLLEENGYGVEGARIIRVGRTEDEGFEERIISLKQIEKAEEIFLSCNSIYQNKKLFKKMG